MKIIYSIIVNVVSDGSTFKQEDEITLSGCVWTLKELDEKLQIVKDGVKIALSNDSRKKD